MHPSDIATQRGRVCRTLSPLSPSLYCSDGVRSYGCTVLLERGRDGTSIICCLTLTLGEHAPSRERRCDARGREVRIVLEEPNPPVSSSTEGRSLAHA